MQAAIELDSVVSAPASPDVLKAQPSPESKAGIISKLFFLWPSPLFQLAKRRLLQHEDLWKLPEGDQAAVISERLEVYHEETAPLIAHYRQRGLLAEYRVRYGVGDMDLLVRTIAPAAQAVNLLASVSSWLWLREGGLVAGR